MTASSVDSLPSHLARYVVEQSPQRYSAEDQAVWRYIMRQLKSYLSMHGHPSYLQGLEKTGLSVEHIPDIGEMDRRLQEFGWGAVPVSGFIPPAAFMEFQSMGLLPIASDMRSIAHLQYTPAPDIVHEAAGHAPILVEPSYGAYLRQYGQIARKAILSQQDLDQYEAIRILSDIKEDPRSTPKEIELAEKRLLQVNSAMTSVSEAALLSRMNWWTAEYGLIGDLKNPKIFGAGLLSSVGEAHSCLGAKVRHLPLSVDCVNYAYDITEPQPQLFVTSDFTQLIEVLQQLSERLAFKRGGVYGLQQARDAKTVNTVELDSGLQVSGVLSEFLLDRKGDPCFIRFSGPCQLAFKDNERPGQSIRRHPHGFSTPIGHLAEGESLGNLRIGQRHRLNFASGLWVEGVVAATDSENGEFLTITWTDVEAWLGQRCLYEKSWGDFDMAVGRKVTSVFAGAADRASYGAHDDFANKRVAQPHWTEKEKLRFRHFATVRDMRETKCRPEEWIQFHAQLVTSGIEDWLIWLEMLELSYLLNLPSETRLICLSQLEMQKQTSAHNRQCIEDGLKLAQASI